MRIGSKTLLWGTHQFVLHPAVMLIAFLKIHRRFPSMAEFLAIWVHDWGYWGLSGLDIDGGENHPYVGARIMERFYGIQGRNLVLGHSATTCRKEGIEKSTLYLPDKYYFILLPPRVHWLLAILSGEHEEYKLGLSENNRHIGFNPWLFRDNLKKRLFEH